MCRGQPAPRRPCGWGQSGPGRGIASPVSTSPYQLQTRAGRNTPCLFRSSADRAALISLRLSLDGAEKCACMWHKTKCQRSDEVAGDCHPGATIAKAPGAVRQADLAQWWEAADSGTVSFGRARRGASMERGGSLAEVSMSRKEEGGRRRRARGQKAVPAQSRGRSSSEPGGCAR